MTSPLLSIASWVVVVPSFDWDKLNPLKMLANIAAQTVTQGWQSFMTALWTGGLWLMGFAFKIVDAFTTPDLSEGGVMKEIYPATFAIGGALALLLGFVQIGIAAWQRDGKGLARLLVGAVQFALAWGGMLGVGAALTTATTALAQGILQIAVGAPSFGSVNLLKSWQPRDGVDAAAATVLGVCGLFLLLAAVGYLMIMMVRAGALVILIATSPISAAGLLSEATRAWFWKSLRWFLAALMIAPLSALVLGVGKKLTDGVLAGAGESTEAAVGQVVVGTVLVILSAFCPLILFRLLAFVDPGTSSGASFRASMDAAGGLAGLLGGQRREAGSGSGAATSQTSDGSSQGEADAGTSAQGRLAAVMGAYGTTAGWLSSAGQATAAFGADVLGAAGVGDPQPYFGVPASGTDGNRRPPPGRPQSRPGTDQDSDPAGPSPHDPSPGGPSDPPPPPPPPVLVPPPPGGAADNEGTAGKPGAGGRPGPGGSAAGGAGAGGGAGGAQAGGAAAAAAV